MFNTVTAPIADHAVLFLAALISEESTVLAPSRHA
jgi:hypothetical protein